PDWRAADGLRGLDRVLQDRRQPLYVRSAARLRRAAARSSSRTGLPRLGPAGPEFGEEVAKRLRVIAAREALELAQRALDPADPFAHERQADLEPVRAV